MTNKIKWVIISKCNLLPMLFQYIYWESSKTVLFILLYFLFTLKRGITIPFTLIKILRKNLKFLFMDIQSKIYLFQMVAVPR